MIEVQITPNSIPHPTKTFWIEIQLNSKFNFELSRARILLKFKLEMVLIIKIKTLTPNSCFDKLPKKKSVKYPKFKSNLCTKFISLIKLTYPIESKSRMYNLYFDSNFIFFFEIHPLIHVQKSRKRGICWMRNFGQPNFATSSWVQMRRGIYKSDWAEQLKWLGLKA